MSPIGTGVAARHEMPLLTDGDDTDEQYALRFADVAGPASSSTRGAASSSSGVSDMQRAFGSSSAVSTATSASAVVMEGLYQAAKKAKTSNGNHACLLAQVHELGHCPHRLAGSSFDQAPSGKRLEDALRQRLDRR